MLTEKQQAILDFIQDYLEAHQYPPSVREIGRNFGIYPATVQDHLAAIERKGFLKKKKFQSRTLSVSTTARRGGSPGIPIVGTVAAGVPILAQENIEDVIHLPERWATTGSFLLKVKGDSMEGAHILDGDYVLVQPQKSARDGEIVVALIGDEATVKRFYKTPQGVTLKAENPRFKDIQISNADAAGSGFQIIGCVSGVMRLMKKS
jgi:repressor LexA